MRGGRPASGLPLVQQFYITRDEAAEFNAGRGCRKLARRETRRPPLVFAASVPTPKKAHSRFVVNHLAHQSIVWHKYE